MSESPNDENDVVTISEILEYETRNLAGCDNDDSCCTFPKGYVYRQALYLCISCLKLTGKPAGICYPCSIHCHKDHVLLDLFTKRNFRCDCGNENFPKSNNCKLWEEKDDMNKYNVYNHNYSGVFCVCASEYKESQESEDMYQCNICEDWYHLTHLSEAVEELTLHKTDIIEGSKEFTCKSCLHKSDFLGCYNKYYLNKLNLEKDSGSCTFEHIKKTLNDLPNTIEPLSCGAFWPEDWRQILCSCDGCAVKMQSDGLGYLLDYRDQMSYYYSQLDDADRNDEEGLREVLSELPYTQAITIAEGIANYKRELARFISSQDPDKVVTSEDVNAFFDSLKRRRLDDGHE